MNRVNLERGKPSQRETLANLVQLYIHDFSEYLTAQRKLAVEEDGRFADLLRLEDYWSESDRSVCGARSGWSSSTSFCVARMASTATRGGMPTRARSSTDISSASCSLFSVFFF